MNSARLREREGLVEATRLRSSVLSRSAFMSARLSTFRAARSSLPSVRKLRSKARGSVR
jgi:hypothetical protein